MNLDDWRWLAAPAAALAFGLVLLVPLGVQVLERGVVFIDLAVAQVAAFGALGAALLVDHPSAWQSGLAALAAALLGAALVRLLARAWPEHREALIGLLYVTAASAAVLAASADAHGKERISALLAADVLWAPWLGIGWMALVAAVRTVVSRRVPGWAVRDAWFFPLFAAALSAAVPVLGLYLVFALLIGPALWVRRGRRPGRVMTTAGLAAMAGMAVSWGLDWPSGACVALAIGAFGTAAACAGPAPSP